MKTKQEMENDFDWWITCIPDKIERLEELLPSEILTKLDYSIASLEVVGKYLCEVIITIDNLKKSAELWDCCASYVGTTYRRNVPSAQWRVELENDKDVYYGVPALRTDVMTNFYPLYEISAMLDRKRPDFLQAITKRHIELQNKV